MQVIEIIDLCGIPPYTIEICDYTFTYCNVVSTGVTEVPVFVTIPDELQNTFQVIVKVTDVSGCTEFHYYSSFSPTPTPTPTLTPTSTPTSECRCIVFTNPEYVDINFGYTQCDGSSFYGTCTSGTTYYACGSNPYVENTKLFVNIYGECINGSCPRNPFPATPTPTPTITPTNTITPTYTPSNTVTPSITSTLTTPTPTKTVTKTPRVTNSPTPAPFVAYLFVEPNTGSTLIGDWMYTVNGQNFFGFTNGSQPTQNQTDFNNELNIYVDFSGWTAGTFPSVITQSIPKVSGGVDSFGNSIVANNFKTTIVPSNTISGSSWFVWMIPTGATNGLYQSQIDYSIHSPNSLTPVNMESTIYSYTFYYTGTTIPQTTYRVYTTFPGVDFNLSNLGINIYFKGNSLSS